jgi:hypothetical protein
MKFRVYEKTKKICPRGDLDSRRGLGIFLFITAPRTALGPTQPPIQWVPAALSLGVKRPERKANRLPPSSAEVKERVELYLHSPNTPSWRGAQFKKAQGQLYIYVYISLIIYTLVRRIDKACKYQVNNFMP